MFKDSAFCALIPRPSIFSLPSHCFFPLLPSLCQCSLATGIGRSRFYFVTFSNFDFLCSLHFWVSFSNSVASFLCFHQRVFFFFLLAHFSGVVRPGCEASRKRNWRFRFFSSFFFFARFLGLTCTVKCRSWIGESVSLVFCTWILCRRESVPQRDCTLYIDI